ncbi:MAG TPA: phosphoribosyltransferase family protein [Daejeonella sp.]|nr:phosphoribosyltransferase family protein [Daejeonella sp.]
MFKDRTEAGLLLAAKLRKYKNTQGIVLAVPRGGVPVAYMVAKELGFPLEVILIKKIGHPHNKEYAIGAASLTDYFIVPHENVPEAYIQEEVGRVHSRLQQMHDLYMGERKPESIEGKTVIVVDDGIATGNTMLATIQVLQKSRPAKIVIAVPVSSKSALQKLSREVDEVISVLIPEHFFGIGEFYKDFEQLNDEKVIYYLDQLRKIKHGG